MKRLLATLVGVGCWCGTVAAQAVDDGIRTTFQTAQRWKPTTDVRADAVMCYGTRTDLEERVKSWRERGYVTHFMTGIAWGEYQDYFNGRWDGKKHLDEGQVALNNDSVGHGYMIPYIVPTLNYIRYFKETQIKRVIDAGIDAIFLEEPEFWARSGYSDAFKREWKAYYGTEWKAQHLSPENTYLSNKLKYQLYYRALNEVGTYAKEYGRTKGLNVRVYVPTHSLLNYSQWRIVSPEASLASLDCIDGYIAQVWTGTAREPNYYNGVKKERVFETAFLEYGCMESMTAPTRRKVFFLTDPIEDRPRDWQDYKRNYQATFTAKLLYPRNNNYEVMPWPDRIYEGLYRTSPHSDQRERIPRFYSTQMQVMINTLNQMPLSMKNRVSGNQGISVMMANSLMFQRGPTHFNNYYDPQLSNFYGLALPLLKRGVPVGITHLENVGYAETWNDVKVLLMTYSNMKPLDPAAHEHLAQWVRNGGVLVYCGRDNDPYQRVEEWWNTRGRHYEAPSDHLFESLGIRPSGDRADYKVGRGHVYVLRQDPKEFVMQTEGDVDFLSVVKRAYEQSAKAGRLKWKNHFYLERGVYTLLSVMEGEGPVADHDVTLKGEYIDLFDPELPVLHEKTVSPGEQAFLIDLKKVKQCSLPQVVATAARVSDEVRTEDSYRLTVKSPIETTNSMCVLLPAEPKTVKVTNAQGESQACRQRWEKGSRILHLSFENHPDGIRVELSW